MLRKSNPPGARKPSAPGASADDDVTSPKRTWAAMRARLRHGREPLFPPPAAEAAVASTPATPPAQAMSRTPHVAGSPAPTAPPGAIAEAKATPAPSSQGAPHRAVAPNGGEGLRPAALDKGVSEKPTHAPPANGADQPAPRAAEPRANGADHDPAGRRAPPEPTRTAAPNGAEHSGRAPEAPTPAPHAAARTATPAPTPHGQPAPEPGAQPGVLLGHVMSVAGSVIWGVLAPNVADAAEIGAVVRLQSSHGRNFGLITTLKSDGRRGGEDDRRLVEIKLLGEILSAGVGKGRFQRGVSSHPPLDSPIHAASAAELRAMYARPEAATVRLGTLRHTADLPAYAMTDYLLGRHFAVLGTTGAGKSCAVTVIMRALLDAHPFGHVIMLDPHNEYGRAFKGHAELLGPDNLKLPYWLLNYEELASILVSTDSSERAYAEGAILKEALLEARRGFYGPDDNPDHVTVDTPVPYRLSELIRLIREAMGAFNRPENSAPYQHLISKLEAMSTDKRYAFMFSSFLVQDNMQQVLARILRIPVQDKPITIIDLSGVPSEIVDVVVSVLCRVVFEFALWSERAKAPPILLVCEEAHRYVPRDDQTGFAPTKRSISRIAKEGRKYGLSLCLVTQRPSELSISSLSQCNTIFALRLGNEHDLEFVRHAVPDSSRWLTDALPALNTQEALVLGDGVSVPMHIRFDELAEAHRPASTTPPFSAAWQSEVEDVGVIAETIERWRHQIRSGATPA